MKFQACLLETILTFKIKQRIAGDLNFFPKKSLKKDVTIVRSLIYSGILLIHFKIKNLKNNLLN